MADAPTCEVGVTRVFNLCMLL